MTTQTITGASDDHLLFEGLLHDQVDCYHQTVQIELQDSTLIGFRYDQDGIWRATLLNQGSVYRITIDHGDLEEDTNDILSINGGRVDYAICRTSEGDVQIVGTLPLTLEQKSLFNTLQHIFRHHDTFDSVQDSVRAAITGRLTV